jgi:hypothetical protein
MTRLQILSEAEMAQLMALSPKLSALTLERCRAWKPEHKGPEARPAAFVFAGEAFESLDASSFTPGERTYAQAHLRILSGLYGLLRPLDLIQAHRLEMATRLAPKDCRSLYEFWSERITHHLMTAAKKTPLVNLASQEYSKVVKAPMLTLHFQEPNGKVQSFAAKRARGLMARFAIQQRIQDPQKLKTFTEEGYAFRAKDSDEENWVFRH